MLTRKQHSRKRLLEARDRRTILQVVKAKIVNLDSLSNRYTAHEIEDIIKTYCSKVIENCITKQEGFQFPHGIGIIIIGKFKPRKGTKAELLADISQKDRNMHDPYICKWTWKSDRYTYWGNKIPSKFFRFRASPKARKGLHNTLINAFKGITSDKFHHLLSKKII